jgi:hypothetical protein
MNYRKLQQEIVNFYDKKSPAGFSLRDGVDILHDEGVSR